MKFRSNVYLSFFVTLLLQCHGDQFVNISSTSVPDATDQYITSVSILQKTNAIPPPKSVTDRTTQIRNFIQRLCKKKGLYGSNCTCERAAANITSSIDLCSFLKTNKTDVVVNTFSCQKVKNYIEATFTLIASTIGLIGNGIVIIISFKNWSRFRNCQQLIGFLAFSDFTYAISNIFVRLPLFWDCRWKYGLAMCRGIHAISDLSGNMALGFIVIISVERYYGVVKPFSRGLTKTKLLWLSALNTIAAIISVSPVIPARYLTKNGLCGEDWPIEHGQIIYDWFLVLFYFILPLLIIFILYVQIMIKLRKRVNDGNSSMLDLENRMKRLQDNNRIMVILAIVVVAFFLLVFPSRIVLLIIDHTGKNNLSTSEWNTLHLVLFIPYYFHVICNPIIYSMVDKRFRLEVKKLFRCQNKLHSTSTYSSQMLELKSSRTSKLSLSKSSFSTRVRTSTKTSPNSNYSRRLTINDAS